MLGIRRGAEAERDERLPAGVLFTAVAVVTALVVVGFGTLAHFLTRDRAQKQEAPVEAASAVAPKLHGPVTVADTIEDRVRPCTTCHGAETQLTGDGFSPRIAGKPAGYLYDQLVNFRDRRRQSATMNYMVAYLSDAYLHEIAEHYAALPPPPPPAAPIADRATLARGEALVLHGDRARDLPACVSCHGKELSGMQPSVPGLLGLDPRYVAAQMGAWRSGLRRAKEPDCMANVASLLAPGDISAIASWLASRVPGGDRAPLAARSLR
ncbi:MAG TPA: hypothetical protein VF038_18590, partial [Usitatibacter sp.]